MGNNHAGPLIRFKNLSHIYLQGGCPQRVLDGLNGEIGRGETVALLGRSGCGKSTLLNITGGIDTPSDGMVFIDGVNITALDEYARTLFRRRNIGFVYQFFNLIPTLSVAENLLLPLELNGWTQRDSHDRIEEILDEVGLSDRADGFPDQLSGGEQQRVAVARALIHRPLLVLADEPTGNLDVENGQQVLEMLGRMVRNNRNSLLIVTHSQAVAARADRVLTLEQGRLSGVGNKLVW